MLNSQQDASPIIKPEAGKVFNDNESRSGIDTKPEKKITDTKRSKLILFDLHELTYQSITLNQLFYMGI